MEILNHYRFIVTVIALILILVTVLPFAWREIRRKREARRLENRIVPVSTLTPGQIESIRSLDPEGRRLHPVINRSVCVGCGNCVMNCREKGALFLINGKSTLVDPLACRCHGDCEQNCLTGALRLVEYGHQLTVRVPWVDEHFQSNIPGLYIVGALTGAGLIKEAINQGRAAVNSIMRDVFPPDLPLVAVIGAGPAGLSAMLSCRKFGLPVTCFEKDATANTIRNFPKRKVLMAEPVEMPIYGPLWVGDTTREKLLEAWERILIKTGVQITTDSRLEGIVKVGDKFQLTLSGRNYQSDRVILALGNRGTPRKLGVPGEDGAQVYYNLLDAEEFAGATVTVTGAGDSAIEAALALRRNDCRVTMLVRGDGFPKAKARNQERIAQAVAAEASHRCMTAARSRPSTQERSLSATRRARTGSTANSCSYWRAANSPSTCWPAWACASSKSRSVPEPKPSLPGAIPPL